MEEIKFRFWNGARYLKLIDGYMMTIDGRVFNDRGIEEDFIEKEQYTGLKDKNDVEIYKGDLINVTDPYNGNTANGSAKVVFSHEYSGGWVATSNDINSLNLGTRTRYIEVVGNIHENPELLK